MNDKNLLITAKDITELQPNIKIHKARKIVNEIIVAMKNEGYRTFDDYRPKLIPYKRFMRYINEQL